MPAYPPAVSRVVDAAAQMGVELRVVTFDQSTHTAAEAAQAVGAELGQIVKSLVFIAPGDDGEEACLALVSGVNRVDVPRLAQALGVERLRRASADEARRHTGFSIGGIPPFGSPRPLATVMDPDLRRHATVWAAAGTPNAVFEITPERLEALAGAAVAPITPAVALPDGGGQPAPSEPTSGPAAAR